MNEKALIVIAAMAGLSSGCASLTEAHYQIFSVQARQKNLKDVIGATCELASKNGQWFLTTPGTIMIPRSNEEVQVVCRKAEQEPGSATVVPGMRAAIFGNVVNAGVGAIIDYSNRAAYEYPEFIQIVMGTSTRIELSGGTEKYTSLAQASSAETPKIQAISNTKPEQDTQPSSPEDNAAVIAEPNPGSPRQTSPAELASFNFKMLRGDGCDAYVSEKNYCWWRPPGRHGDCPAVTSLKKCKAAYGHGCRLEHGPELPKC